MIAKRSKLILENFVVLDSSCSIVVLDESIEFDPIKDTESLPVEIDFKIEKEVDSDRYRIFVSLEINNSADKKNGYSITANGMGFFSFEPNANLNETEKAQFLEMSGLSICITNLRSFVTNTTAYYPWGSFTFYAIDVVTLLKEKKEAEGKEVVS